MIPVAKALHISSLKRAPFYAYIMLNDAFKEIWYPKAISSRELSITSSFLK